jgi:hypothetical protein
MKTITLRTNGEMGLPNTVYAMHFLLRVSKPGIPGSGGPITLGEGSLSGGRG